MKLLKSELFVTRIQNNDDLFCARATVVAKVKGDDDECLDSRCHLQETLAGALHEEAHVRIGPYGLDQLKLFEIVLVCVSIRHYLGRTWTRHSP